MQITPKSPGLGIGLQSKREQVYILETSVWSIRRRKEGFSLGDWSVPRAEWPLVGSICCGPPWNSHSGPCSFSFWLRLPYFLSVLIYNKPLMVTTESTFSFELRMVIFIVSLSIFWLAHRIASLHCCYFFLISFIENIYPFFYLFIYIYPFKILRLSLGLTPGMLDTSYLP